MKKYVPLKSIVILITMFISSSVFSAPDWGYSGHKGPKNWTHLKPENLPCSGKNQSPINLSHFMEAEMPPITFNYSKGGYEILNNGHTVQVNYKKGSNIKVDGTTFNLLQFHFHTPGENKINGHSFPLEGHLVHTDKDGNLLVVAIMFKEGTTNKGLENLWAKMPQHTGDKYKLSTLMDASDILPKSHAYYRYNGSLTTPPCSEGVRWVVLKNTVIVSKSQIDTFAKVMPEPNNRPLQKINARIIFEQKYTK